MREEKDRSSKWLLEHHGDSVLRLGGVTGFVTWRSVRPELVHPRQLPDGLLEATFPGQEAPAPYVVEVATYPERRAEEEAARDAMNDPSLLTILGGRQAMIESPVLIELLNERERDVLHRMILQNLTRRFGPVPEALAARVRGVQALDCLSDLCGHAADCLDLDTFRTRLPS